jgi:serine/threonine-protein kinase
MPVVENVATARLTGTSHFSISPAGALVYTAGPRGPSDNTLLWVDRQGVARPVAEARRAYTYVRISPDGQRVALIVGDDFDKNQDVWILEVARGTLTRFTFGPGLTQEPIWSPDGKQVTYTMRTTSKSTEVLRKAADGSGADEPLLASGGSLTAGSWSPDGKWLAFHDEASGILVLPMDGSRKPKPFAVTFKEDQPQFSPDGRWIAYRSFESGRSEVYVRPFPGPGGKWQVSTDGGSAPIWNRNGRELFYRSGDRLMAVAVSLGQTFAAGTPLELFRGPYFSISNRESYDVAPDGQHFLMIRREQSPAPAHLNVVLDWFTELARVTASPRARAEF